jgi:hypothetical protein
VIARGLGVRAAWQLLLCPVNDNRLDNSRDDPLLNDTSLIISNNVANKGILLSIIMIGQPRTQPKASCANT